ncbi:hypothetical protein D3C86_1419320 [compost metagenome]
MDVDVEIPAVLVVLAEQARIVTFVDGCLQRLTLAHIFAANVDIGRMRTHGETGDHAAFDQRMRIVAQDFAVLAGAGLGFVGVDDEIMRTTVIFLRHEGPLETRREASAAATTKAGSLHLVDDPVTTLFDDLLGTVPMAARLHALQGLVLEAVEIGKDAILIF